MDRDLAHIADIVQSAHAIKRFVTEIDPAGCAGRRHFLIAGLADLARQPGLVLAVGEAVGLVEDAGLCRLGLDEAHQLIDDGPDAGWRLDGVASGIASAGGTSSHEAARLAPFG